MSIMRSRFKIMAGALALIGFQAYGNLVVNGDFETGNFNGWTRSGNAGFTLVTGNSYAQSGSYGAALGPNGSDGFLSQTIATTIGTTYDISFWHFGYNSGPNDFTASFGGVVLLSYVNSTTQPTSYNNLNALYAFTVVATSTSAVLQFQFRDDYSYQGLDNISVVAAPRVLSVPDSGPGLALTAVTLLGVCGVFRKFSHQIVVKC